MIIRRPRVAPTLGLALVLAIPARLEAGLPCACSTGSWAADPSLVAEDWSEVLIVSGDLAGLLRERGGTWRARGLGVDVVRPPALADPCQWYLAIQADPRVLSLEPNYRVRRPGQRQISLDILEINALDPGLQPDYPGIEPVPAEGIVVAVADGRIAPISLLSGRLLPTIDVLGPAKGSTSLDPALAWEEAFAVQAHGTAMAALVARLAEGSWILPVRVVGDNGTTTAFDLARGMAAAADAGAHVVNLSVGTPRSSSLLAKVVASVQARGVLIVASAGSGSVVEHPAALPGVVAVTAVGADGLPAFGAALGPRIDLAAPGVGVVSMGPFETVVSVTGTSPAAAITSAAAAAVVRAMPGGTHADRRAALLGATTAPSLVLDGRIGAGVLDMRLLAAELSVEGTESGILQ